MGRITETHIPVAIVSMVTVNVGAETNITVTLIHGLRKAEVNLSLMGLGLNKYIELREN